MFGGFIRHQGVLEAVTRQGEVSKLKVSHNGEGFTENLAPGRSVAVNGVCLTVTTFSENSFTVECSRETMSKSALGSLKPKSVLNLELPITLNTLLDGHIVSGHVDTVGKVRRIAKDSGNVEITFSFDPRFGKYLVEKGSVAINGISLTAFNVTSDAFTVSVISHTCSETNLKFLKEQDTVNLEFDLIGKYVLNSGATKNNGLTGETLARHGFL